MSSLRNPINRRAHKERAHKERAQPNARRKSGLLEKHKDYIVRAKGYHKKGETLQKVPFRNPDEFCFKMIKTRTVDGVHKPEDEAKEIRSRPPQDNAAHTFEDLPDNIKRKTAASYRELVTRKSRASELQKLYMEMALKSQLQKNGQKRELREHEIISPTSRPVHKWRSER